MITKSLSKRCPNTPLSSYIRNQYVNDVDFCSLLYNSEASRATLYFDVTCIANLVLTNALSVTSNDVVSSL